MGRTPGESILPPKVQQAIAEGWSVIPTGLKKLPLVRTWKPYQSRRASAAELSSWSKIASPCWAVITGPVSDLVVLDFDGEAGNQTLERLGLKPHVRTPSGGHHVYLRHPGWPVRTLNSKTKRELGVKFPGLDIRADGGYACFTGRTDKGEYVWLYDMKPCSLDILPAELREFLGMGRPPTPPSNNWEANASMAGKRVGLDHLIGRALDRARSEGRNNAGFWLCQQLRDNGYTQVESETAMRTYASRCPATNTKGQPEPYSGDEIRATLREVFSRPAREPWTGRSHRHASTRQQTEPPDGSESQELPQRTGAPIRWDFPVAAREDVKIPSSPDERVQSLIEGVIAKLGGEPDALFQPALLCALYEVKRRDLIGWGRIKAVIRKQKIPMKDLLQAMEAARTRPISSNGEQPKPQTAGEMLADTPLPGLVIPATYLLDTNGTYRVGTTAPLLRDTELPEKLKIAFNPIVITEKLIDIDDGHESLRVAWRVRGHWFDKMVERATILDSRKILELANVGFPVASDNAKSVSRYLHVLEAWNCATLPITHVVPHLGWAGAPETSGFLSEDSILIDRSGEIVDVSKERRASDANDQRNLVLFKGQTVGDEQVISGFRNAGTLAGWKAAIEPLQCYPRGRLALYLSFVPPLLEILAARNFIVDFTERTTTGKTTLLRIAASVWGRPAEGETDSVLGTWDSTPVWIERAAANISGLPLILDDTKRAKRPEQVAQILYAVAQGRGRGRGNIRGLQDTRCFKTVLISSGEQPATSFMQDGGTRTRCMEIRGLPFGVVDNKTNQTVVGINTGIQANYGHAGRAFVQHIIKNKSEWTKWRNLFSTLTREYASRSKGPEGGRMACDAAVIDLAASVAHQALDLPWDYREPLEELWSAITGEAEGADGELRALYHVVSWAHAHKDSFHGKALSDRVPAQWSGRWEDGKNRRTRYIAFFSYVIEAILKDQGYAPEAILHGWRERGWLDVTEDGKKRYTKRIRPSEGEDATHLVAINAAGLNAAGEQGAEP